MKFRAYTDADRDACLRILDSNTPKYFADYEPAQFAEFLAKPEGVYLVGEEDGSVVACGGWHFNEETSRAGLTWGMVDRAHHGRRYGQALLDVRLEQIRALGRATIVKLTTTQWVQGFFERNGFVAKETVKDGFGPGLDSILMEKDLHCVAVEFQ